MLEITIKNTAAGDIDIQKIIEEIFHKDDRLDVSICIDNLPKDLISVNNVNTEEGDISDSESKVSKTKETE